MTITYQITVNLIFSLSLSGDVLLKWKHRPEGEKYKSKLSATLISRANIAIVFDS